MKSILAPAVLATLRSYGVDLCGENGEYHTVVVDAPLFRHRWRGKIGDWCGRSGSAPPI